MRVSPVNFKFNSQNSPSQKGFSKFVKVKGEGLPRVRYTPCADEEFPEGGTKEQRDIICEYYTAYHFFALPGKPKEFIYHIDYPMETTTIALQDAYYNGELDKYPEDLANKVREEIRALEKDDWDGCSRSAIDKRLRDKERERLERRAAEADRIWEEANRI